MGYFFIFFMFISEKIISEHFHFENWMFSLQNYIIFIRLEYMGANL